MRNATELATMASHPMKNSKEVVPTDDTTMDDDDITVVTATPTAKTDFIEAEMMDLLLRYEIPFTTGHPQDDDFKNHVQLLIAITKTFDKSNIRIYDNKNTRVKSFAEQKWMNKEYFNDHFTMHIERSQRKTILVHRIMTTKSISTIKNDPTVMQHLKQSTTFLRGHFWKEDEVLLKDIGFLVSYVATKHSKEYVSRDMFKRCGRFPDVEWAHAPEFKLIHAQPKIKLSGKQKPLKTHAFSVQVLAQDATKMNHFLQKIYSDTHFYVPYSMKKKFPKAVAQAMLKQNKLIQETWVIALIGVSREIMQILEPKILVIPGVTGISDTNRTNKAGRWHVLVKENLFKSTRKQLTAQLQNWYNAVPANLIDSIPDGFSRPQVHQKNSYDDDEDSSLGQDSYMSSCAQSYGSIDENIEDDEFCSTPGTYRSYAAVLAGSVTTAPSIMEVITQSRNSSDPTVTSVSEQEYKTVITGLQSDITIANLQAEVKLLKAQLLGAQTPSTVTESSAPEPPGTHDRMASIEANMEAMTAQFTEWMLELRRQPGTPPKVSEHGTKHTQASYLEQLPSSQQSKRADTRSTPDRTQPQTDVQRTRLFQDPREDYGRAIDSSPTPSSDRMDLSGIDQTAISSHPYDPARPQHLYCANGDGTLFCVGIAGPSDFDDGNIRGLRPSKHQPNPDVIEAAASNLSIPRSDSPMETTLATADSSPTSTQETTSPTQLDTSLMGSAPSLPAEGAFPYS